jgi:hypothetical protein
MTPNDMRRIDRYAGDVLMRQQAASDAIKQRRAQGGLAPQEFHQLSDQLREIAGSVRLIHELAPRIEAEHKRGVQWAVERVAVAVRRVAMDPYLESAQVDALQARLRAIVAKLESGQLDGAEEEVRGLELCLEELATTGAAAEFDALMSTVDALYVTVQ